MLGNWISENTATTGTGTISLGGAVSADLLPFSSQLPSGWVGKIIIKDGNNREEAIVTLASGTPWTLTRVQTLMTAIGGVVSINPSIGLSLSGSAIVSIDVSASDFGLLPRGIVVPYSVAQTGFNGAINTTTSATLTYLQAGTSANTIGISSWIGEVVGTDCYFYADNSAHTQTNFINAAVDGAAAVAVTGVGGKFPIFTGLQDTKHQIKITIGSAYGTTNANVTKANTLFQVNGLNPVLAPALFTANTFDGTANVYNVGFAAATPASYTPATSTSYYGTYSSIPSVMFRSATRRLIVNCGYGTGYAFVSIDGAAPTRYGPLLSGMAVVPCDGNTHTYNVWSAGYTNIDVGVDGPFQTITSTPKRLVQFGDSLTFGAYASTEGNVETFGAAAGLGCVGSTFGLSGQTVEGLYADLTGILAGITTNTSADVAVLAIGRNNVGAVWTSTTNTDYAAMITQLRAKFNKVICRGILNGGSGSTAPYLPSNATWPTENGYIQTLVTNAADPNVTYVDPTAWTDVAMANSTHPNDAGYATLIGHCITAYTGKI